MYLFRKGLVPKSYLIEELPQKDAFRRRQMTDEENRCLFALSTAQHNPVKQPCARSAQSVMQDTSEEN